MNQYQLVEVIEVHKAHDEAVAKLAERKSALLRVCDDHESSLLKKLDKLAEKDNELISRISNKCELMGKGVEALATEHGMKSHDTLKDLLRTNDPDLSEVTAITKYAEILQFRKKQLDLNFGEVLQMGDVRWKEKICVNLSQKMYGAAPTPDGRMAFGHHRLPGGIEIFSADGKLQQTVLQSVPIRNIAFLSDGRCVVRDTGYVISLYTPDWKKLDVTFDSLGGKGGGLAVDCDDLIYVGYWKANKIQVFTPQGGKAVREISFTGLKQRQISVMGSSKMLVVMNEAYDIRVLDQQGKEVHSVVKEKGTNALYATVRRYDYSCSHQRKVRQSQYQAVYK